MENPMNTHGTDGDSVTVGLPMEDTRRELIALRNKHGATSAIGARCSNIIELVQNAEAISGADRERCIRFIGRQMDGLQRLLA